MNYHSAVLALAAVFLALAACAPARDTASSTGQPAPSAPAGPAARDVAQAPAGPAPGAAGAPLKKVVIGYPSNVYGPWLPFQIAAEQGFFTAEGLELEYVRMAPDTVPAALDKREADFYAAIGGATTAAQLRGLPLVGVFALTVRPIHAMVVEDKVTSPEMLRGGKMGVTVSNGQDAFMVRYHLRQLGIDPREVDFVHIGGEDARIAALLEGLIDGTTLIAPQVFAMQEKGIRPLQLGPDLQIEWPGVGGLTTSQALLRDDRAKVVGTIKALLRGLDWYRAQPAATTELIVRVFGVSDDVARQTYTYMDRAFTQDGTASEEGLRRLYSDAQQAAGLPESPVDLTALLDFGPLSEAHSALQAR